MDVPRENPSPESKTLARIRAMNLERVTAKQLLAEIVARGLTPELREKGRRFLERHPD